MSSADHTRPPTRSRASRTTTSWPACTIRYAAISPANPAPTTTTRIPLPPASARTDPRARRAGGFRFRKMSGRQRCRPRCAARRSGRRRPGPGASPGPRDVVQVMDRVVNEVAGERLDREMGAVAAAAGALPLNGGHVPETDRDSLGGFGQFTGHHDGILLAVTVSDRGGVLIPVGVQGIVLGQHQLQPLVIQPQDVADMAAVLQG